MFPPRSQGELSINVAVVKPQEREGELRGKEGGEEREVTA